MTDRRFTLVVDTKRYPGFELLVRNDDCITIESVEDVPEPNKVQEFRVRVERKPHLPPWPRHHVDDLLDHGKDRLGRWTVTVTEVEPS